MPAKQPTSVFDRIVQDIARDPEVRKAAKKLGISVEAFIRTTAQQGVGAAIASVTGGRAPGAPDPDDPHVILGVAPDDPLEVVEAVYRAKAKAYHPDSHPEASGAEKVRLTARFARLQAAYEEVKRAKEE